MVASDTFTACGYAEDILQPYATYGTERMKCYGLGESVT